MHQTGVYYVCTCKKISFNTFPTRRKLSHIFKCPIFGNVFPSLALKCPVRRFIYYFVRRYTVEQQQLSVLHNAVTRKYSITFWQLGYHYIIWNKTRQFTRICNGIKMTYLHCGPTIFNFKTIHTSEVHLCQNKKYCTTFSFFVKKGTTVK